ncbi:hypothetical protein A2477_00070 [Candidatus Falkowbacteria bacterium RIFOXYC2_FULL_47_12]|uniref:PDZ domain-containing protein n=2 Tax=Candidatus Falkowiibacteriota TaxID=1752728 RepID=A0A1F5TR86_9BACT|nr:MAG: hypothetical protein A2242_00400 [Candidatus Falkowbacteria bacterium RIFOXYA2_FULL_47_9]OGF41445.1 MAG: hypothetical protein A2477_00070 [Candidatus Falkowbacteria bacterium RIFOXYC2_FULL_47_12]
MSKNNKIFIFIAIVIISLAGGVAGGILVRSYFLNSSFNVPLFGDINVGGQYRDGNLVISSPKKVVVEQNDRIAAVTADVQKSLVDFYKKKTASAATDKDTPVDIRATLASFYSQPERLGWGLVLTNDGWILTTLNSVKAGGTVVAASDGTFFEVEKNIADKQSGYSFVKVNATNLVAAQFSGKNDITDGQIIIGLAEDGVAISHVRQAHGDAGGVGVRSSELVYETITVDDETLALGTVMVGLDGTVAGFYHGQGLVVPMYQYAWLLPGLLSNGAVRRPYLGVRYLNLYEFIGPEKLKGALITKDARGVSVAKGSPAATAGLAEDDVITAVDGRAVTADDTLSGLIVSHRPGDEVELTIVREAKEQRVTLTLGTAE